MSVFWMGMCDEISFESLLKIYCICFGKQMRDAGRGTRMGVGFGLEV